MNRKTPLEDTDEVSKLDSDQIAKIEALSKEVRRPKRENAGQSASVDELRERGVHLVVVFWR